MKLHARCNRRYDTIFKYNLLNMDTVSACSLIYSGETYSYLYVLCILDHLLHCRYRQHVNTSTQFTLQSLTLCMLTYMGNGIITSPILYWPSACQIIPTPRTPFTDASLPCCTLAILSSQIQGQISRARYTEQTQPSKLYSIYTNSHYWPFVSSSSYTSI